MGEQPNFSVTIKPNPPNADGSSGGVRYDVNFNCTPIEFADMLSYLIRDYIIKTSERK